MLLCLLQVLQQLIAAGNHKSHPFHRRPIVLLADVEKKLLHRLLPCSHPLLPLCLLQVLPTGVPSCFWQMWRETC